MELAAAYRLLGLTPPVTWAIARSAWRKVAARLHPDRGGSSERFKEARIAWERVDAALTGAAPPPSTTNPPPPTSDLNLGTPLVLRELRLDGLRMPAAGTARLIQCGDEVLLQVDLDAPIVRLGSWFEATLLLGGAVAASLRGPIIGASYERPAPHRTPRVTAFSVRPTFGPR